MGESTGSVSGAAFALAVLCFFMPFVSVSCAAMPSARVTLSGLNLATGTTVETPQGLGETRRQRVGPMPKASLALLLGVAACAIAFGKVQFRVAAAFGGLGAVMLLLVRSELDSEILSEGQGLIVPSFEPGFWLAFAAFIAGGLTSFMAAQQSNVGEGGSSVVATPQTGRSTPSSVSSRTTSAAAAQPVREYPETQLCPSCGELHPADARQCSCGHKFAISEIRD